MAPELNFTTPTRTIEVPGGDITVRGLSSEDTAVLVQSHIGVMRGLFEQVIANPDGVLSIAAVMGERVLQEAPGFVSHAIALAAGAGNREGIEKVGTMPMPAQLEVVTAVAELTFHSDEALKKTLALAVRMMRGATATIDGLRNDLQP